jgi:hypothetical protein
LYYQSAALLSGLTAMPAQEDIFPLLVTVAPRDRPVRNEALLKPAQHPGKSWHRYILVIDEILEL